MLKVVALLAIFACFVHGMPTDEAVDTAEPRNVRIVTRAEWGARPPNSRTNLATPVPEVIIHHTVTGACSTLAACSTIMRSMQNHHQNNNGWADIGYNFVVGGDGLVYEGRGWTTLGAHAGGANARSVGIALIGNFVSGSPPQAQLTATRNLITLGMSLGRIRTDHALRGHRQVSATECPGTALFNIIRTWPNFRA